MTNPTAKQRKARIRYMEVAELQRNGHKLKRQLLRIIRMIEDPNYCRVRRLRREGNANANT